MKKVIAVFDGTHFPSAILDMALSLNNSAPILLTGVFLPSVDYAAAVNYYYYGDAVLPVYLQESADDDAAIRQNSNRFEQFCIDNQIRYALHQDISQPVVEALKYETRFADLMLLSSALFYENLGSDLQASYLKDTMHHAECPVLVLPETYAPPRNIILAYDGSAASMYAIRQFSYLMPGFRSDNILVVYAGTGQDELPFPELIKEYANLHFRNPVYRKMDWNPQTYFSTWIENEGLPLLVSGSYGRSFWSELSRKNFAADIISKHQLPVFIAHP